MAAYNRNIAKSRESFSFLIFLFIMFSSFGQENNDISQITNQERDTSIQSFSNNIVTFTKYKAIHSPDSLLFNLLRINNITNTPLKGKLVINLPEDWSFKGVDMPISVDLSPGEQKVYPIWFSLSKKAFGNKTYVVSARLTKSNGEPPLISPFYVFVPKKSDWSITLPENIQYFQNDRNIITTQLRLVNNGNAEENIKLAYKMGEHIRLRSFNFPKDEKYIELAPGRDTVITRTVRFENSDKNPMSYKNYMTNYLGIQASNGKTLTKTAYFLKLSNKFDNEVTFDHMSPLTIQVTAQNILDGQNSLLNTAAFGDIQFKDDRNLNYRINVIGVRNNDNIGLGEQIWRYSTYFAHYHHNKLNVFGGDIASPGFGLAGFGRGASVKYDFLKNLTAQAGIVRNVFQPITSYAANATFNPTKGLSLAGSVDFIDDDFSLTRNRAITLRTSVVLNQSNSISVLGSLSRRNHIYTINDFPLAQDADTTLDGFKVRINHTFTTNRFSSVTFVERASAFFAGPQNGYIGLDNLLKYRINDKNRLSFRTSYNDIENYFVAAGSAIRSPRIVNWMHQLKYSRIITPNFSGSFGAFYRNNIINTFYSSIPGLYPNRAENVSPFLRLNYRFDKGQSVSGMLERGFIRPLDIYIDPRYANTFDPDEVFNNTRVNLTYTKRNAGVTFTYVRGILVANQIQTLPDFGDSRNIFIRPYLTKYYFDKRLQVDFFGSYMVQTVSEFENLNLSIRPQLNLNRGWTLRGFANFLLTRRTLDNENTTSNRSIFLNLGIEKKFDIQQPRVKYYDLELVFFKDIDGNGIKEENEIPLENIITKIALNSEYEFPERVKFNEIDLISNKEGQVIYKNIPQGSYVIKSFSLVNLKDIYNANGEQQIINVNGNTKIYIPFVESFKVSGKIDLVRQEFSDVGLVDLRSIGVSAVNESGDAFKALSNKDGEFVMYLPPKPGLYKISLPNVFGDKFYIEQDEFLVDFNGLKVFEVNFKVVEKKRSVTGSGGYQFKSLTGGADDEQTEEEPTEEEPLETAEDTPAPASQSSGNDGSLNADQEQKLIERLDDLQRQIDELKKTGVQQPQPNLLPNNQNQTQPQEENQANPPSGTNNNSPADNNMQPYDELDDLINQLIEKTNPNDENINLNQVSFRVKLGVFKDQVPVEQMNKLLELGSVETGKDNPDGSSNFISKPFYMLEEAQQYKNNLQQSGFQGIEVVGDYAGSEITVDEAKKLIEEKKKQEGVIDF